MLRQITVNELDAQGRKRERRIELRSQDGKTWYMRLDTMLASQRRVPDITPLTEREKKWIEVLDRPSTVIFNGGDVSGIKAAIRFHTRSAGGEG